MAKLHDLKALIDARPVKRAREAAVEPTSVPRVPSKAATPAPITSLRRQVAAAKHAEGDIDLAQAFADVKRMPPRNRADLREARDTLADFLLDARARGARCVRVIHGKGLTSPGKEPVLKGKVRRWLAHWDDVLAYSEAPRHAGGGGAVLVLLRGTGR
jgi:hypothetical protein